ncbi:MAG: hypothetical protein V1799_19950 [bacterium]
MHRISSIERRKLVFAFCASLLFHLLLFACVALPFFALNHPYPNKVVSLQYQINPKSTPAQAGRQKVLPEIQLPVTAPIRQPNEEAPPLPVTDSAIVLQPRDSLSIEVSSIPQKQIEFWKLTFNEIDSLGRLHPELKEAIFKEALTQSILRKDSVHWMMNKPIRDALAAMRFPMGHEAQMVFHEKVFGTPYNPMRPAPPPNSINILGIIPALENIWRAIVGK